jgi:N6-L-threonylcarbamoyladenine synthase
MRVLGIESSCDDTGLALVTDKRNILAEVRAGQADVHARYGGVVPELAAREHILALPRLVAAVEDQSGLSLRHDVDAIAVTSGPGLVGGLLTGVQFASGLAIALGKPLLGINHLAAHALTPRLTNGVEYPYLLLLASGGHCVWVKVEGPRKFLELGGTMDDAAGEAFDKIAVLLGLGFPGGPAVEQAAKTGDASRYSLPVPLAGQSGAKMSFSGLKNAVRLLVQKEHTIDTKKKSDIAAAFQATVCAHLTQRAAWVCAQHPDVPTLALAGGVASNHALRAELCVVAKRFGKTCVVPPSGLCTDNGAMIAWCGVEWLAAGVQDSVPLTVRPRWPLGQLYSGLYN